MHLSDTHCDIRDRERQRSVALYAAFVFLCMAMIYSILHVDIEMKNKLTCQTHAYI